MRAAEVVGALSLATDLGTGQPLEHALRTAVLAVRLGELAGASPQELADTYYVALLHASGCTSNGHEALQVYDDDIAHRAAFFLIDTTNPAEVLAFYRANIGAGQPPEVRAALVEEALANAGPRARESFATMCEVAQRFAGWLELGSEHPGRARVRLRTLGRTRLPGRPAATRSLCRCASCTWRGTSRSSSPPPAPTRLGPSIERRVGCRVRSSPRRARRRATSATCSRISTSPGCGSRRSKPSRFRSVGSPANRSMPPSRPSRRLTGLKSPWLREHSTDVAELAEAAAWRMGLPGGIRHAGAPRRARSRPRSRRRLERDLGEAGPPRLRRVGARATPPPLHGARVRPVGGAGADRDARGHPPRTARRLRLPPRHARSGTRSDRTRPGRSRLLRGHARGDGPTGRRSTRRPRRRTCCARRRKDGSTRTPSTPC